MNLQPPESTVANPSYAVLQPLPCHVLRILPWIRCEEMTAGHLLLLCGHLNRIRYQIGRSKSKDPRCGRIRVTHRLGSHLEGRLNWQIKIRRNHEDRHQMIGSRHVDHQSHRQFHHHHQLRMQHQLGSRVSTRVEKTICEVDGT